VTTEPTDPPTTPQAPTDGVWVAFNWGGSAFVPFATELDALRYASSYSMTVRFAQFGDEDWMNR
jgi:hypothetical protein